MGLVFNPGWYYYPRKLGVCLYAIDFSQYWPAINEALTIVLGGAIICAAGFLTYALHKYAIFLSASQQERLAKIINEGLNRAAQYALNTIEAHEKDVKITTDSKLVQIGANYALRHMQITLDKAGKTPQDVAEMIVARLPVAPTESDKTGAIAPIPPVTSAALPPV